GERDLAPRRLGRPLASVQVDLVKPQNPDRLDTRYGVDDRVQLALVERTSEWPAGSVSIGGPPDERVQIAVERVGHPALDLVCIGARRDLEMGHNRDGAESDRLKSQRTARSLACVQVPRGQLE